MTIRIPYSLELAAGSFAITMIATPLAMALARSLNALDQPGPQIGRAHV